MSNPSQDQASHNQQARSVCPLELTPADIEAAETLVSLSRGVPSSADVNVSQIWDIRTTTQRQEPVFSSADETANRRSPALGNVPSSGPPPEDPMFELTERLRHITLTHLNPPVVQPDSESTTFATPALLSAIVYDHSSEVPGEVGLFVDLFDFRGYTPHMISNMLTANNIIIPIEYVLRRTGLGESQGDSNLRTLYDRDQPAVREEAKENGDDETRQDEAEEPLWFQED